MQHLHPDTLTALGKLRAEELNPRGRGVAGSAARDRVHPAAPGGDRTGAGLVAFLSSARRRGQLPAGRAGGVMNPTAGRRARGCLGEEEATLVPPLRGYSIVNRPRGSARRHAGRMLYSR